jgi:hypothetical protein
MASMSLVLPYLSLKTEMYNIPVLNDMCGYVSQAMEEVINRLKDLAEQIPHVPSAYPLTQPTFGDGVEQAEIAQLESGLGASLPADFKLFQQQCGRITAMDVWNGYALFDAKHIAVIMADANAPTEIRSGPHEPRLPIGGDGGGNLFVFSLRSQHVSKLNHETAELKVVANSFTDFLQRMREDWEHFVHDDENWRYMAG